MRLLALLAALLVLPLAAACGGDDGGEASPPPGPAATGSDGEETPEGAAQQIDMTADDFEFDPDELTLEPGEVTFELVNDGQAPHALAVEGEGLEESSERIDSGGSTELTVTLAEGTYEIYCPVGDHAERGMVGTLTVRAGGGTGDDGSTTDDEGTTGETDSDDVGGLY